MSTPKKPAGYKRKFNERAIRKQYVSGTSVKELYFTYKGTYSKIQEAATNEAIIITEAGRIKTNSGRIPVDETALCNDYKSGMAFDLVYRKYNIKRADLTNMLTRNNILRVKQPKLPFNQSAIKQSYINGTSLNELRRLYDGNMIELHSAISDVKRTNGQATTIGRYKSTKPRNRYHKRVLKLDKKIVKLYTKDQLNCAQIGRELGIHSMTVKARLIKNNVYSDNQPYNAKRVYTDTTLPLYK